MAKAMAEMHDESEQAVDTALNLDADIAMAGGIAAALIALGQQDRALDFLERVAEKHPHRLLFVHCDEEIRALDGDPRFVQVLERVGFPR